MRGTMGRCSHPRQLLQRQRTVKGCCRSSRASISKAVAARCVIRACAAALLLLRCRLLRCCHCSAASIQPAVRINPPQDDGDSGKKKKRRRRDKEQQDGDGGKRKHRLVRGAPEQGGAGGSGDELAAGLEDEVAPETEADRAFIDDDGVAEADRYHDDPELDAAGEVRGRGRGWGLGLGPVVGRAALGSPAVRCRCCWGSSAA